MRRPAPLFLAALLGGLPLAGCGPAEPEVERSPGDGVPIAPADAGTTTTVPAEAAVPVDPALPAYARDANVTGTITSRGSDTMRAVMDYWSEGFQDVYPGVDAELESKGSSSAPAALIEGSALFGVMSRPMKDDEVQAFEAKFGYKPTEIRTSRDLLAVFVNKDNPLADTGLTLPQVDAIFSANRELGLPDRVERWGQLGVTGPLAEKTISVFGRNSASGTYGYFKDVALGGGDYGNGVQEQSGTSGVITAVSKDPTGIGYSGIGGETSGVRAVPLAADEGGEFYDATVENADSGDYPLARFLLIYVNKAPDADLSPLQREFLKYVFSKEGQERVVRAGYFPMKAAEAAAELEKAGIAVASGSSEIVTDEAATGDAATGDAAIGGETADPAAEPVAGASGE